MICRQGSWRKSRVGGLGLAPVWRKAPVPVATGGGVSVRQGFLPRRGRPPGVWGVPARSSRGLKFQVGQEGVNGGPPPGFHPRPEPQGPGGAGLCPAPQQSPPHAHTQLAHPCSPRSHARPRRAPCTQRSPSCLTSRTTHAPPQPGREPSQQSKAGCSAPDSACAHRFPTELSVPVTSARSPTRSQTCQGPSVLLGYRIHLPHVGKAFTRQASPAANGIGSHRRRRRPR